MRPSRSCPVLFPLVAALTAFSSQSAALIFGQDRRLSVPVEPGSLFGPIGIVYESPRSAYATAFLIDACHALTVQHVFGEQQSATGRKVIFTANVSGPQSSWRTTWATVEADGGLEQFLRRGSGIEVRGSDWALLKLHQCLGKTFGHVELTAQLPAPSEAIAIAGYPGDRPLGGGVTVGTSCRVRVSRFPILLHDCAAVPGNSGSPLFRVVQKDGKSVLEVFAISEAAHSTVDFGRNLIEHRDTYPDAFWNVAMAICGNPNLAAQRALKCREPRVTDAAAVQTGQRETAF
jgi:V8-like Glu-specific endopeptidase